MKNFTRRNFLKNVGVGGGSLLFNNLVNIQKVFAASSNSQQGEILFHGLGFSPMMSHVIVGEELNIVSVASANKLKLVSASTAPETINRRLNPGQKTLLRFREPGLYLLYDAISTHFDRRLGRVIARKQSKSFPLPAYLVVLVTNADGGGLKTTNAHVDIPDTFMDFDPWATIVHADEPVRFTNNDMGMHVVMPSPEPMLMPGPESGNARERDKLWQQHMDSFAPIALKAHGGRGHVTLTQAGLYHYYCPIHAAYSSTDYTFYPLKDYGGYPLIMDGVIVVLPS